MSRSLLMAPRWFEQHQVDDWLRLASQSSTIAEVVRRHTDVRYVTFMTWMKKYRPEMLGAMQAQLKTTVSNSLLPRCQHADGCDRHVKARGLCKRHYEQWLLMAEPGEKIRRAVYPPDGDIVTMFTEEYSMARVARRVGVARGTLRDYIDHRPDLRQQIQSYLRLPAEVVQQRNLAAGRRWRLKNPERRRAANRRWAANRSKGDVKRWNVYNADRRKTQARSATPVMSVQEALDAAAYTQILRHDPCVYCGGVSGTIEHIRPINHKGADGWENYAAACLSCNSSKKDRELLQFLLWRLDRASWSGGDALPVGSLFA